MEEEIKNSVKALKSGKTILYPTDTVWGIGCDAGNARAVSRIYKLKRRTENKSMIVLLDDPAKLKNYMKKVPPVAIDLLESIDTPLTIIYPESKNLAKNVVANDHSIAIRITTNEFCRRMIAEFGKPIVSTSANLAGERSPLVFSQIHETIRNGVDYVVNLYHRKISESRPSTIIKLEVNGEFRVIRD